MRDNPLNIPGYVAQTSDAKPLPSCDVNLERLEDGAMQSVYELLDDAIDLIDGKFGDGYAAKHPALLAGFMQAHATFYLAERLAGESSLTDAIAHVGEVLTG
jgi:hypothetical protein